MEIIDVGECRECEYIGDRIKCKEYQMCRVTMEKHDADIRADERKTVLEELFWKIMNDTEVEKNDKGWHMVQLQEVFDCIEYVKEHRDLPIG